MEGKSPKFIPRIKAELQGMTWAVCLFCQPMECTYCDECQGTDRDTIPWTELFPCARIAGRRGAGQGAGVPPTLPHGD